MGFFVDMDAERASRHAGGQSGQRRALLLCNSKYDGGMPELPGVKRDFERLSKVLAAPMSGGFEVTPLLDEGLLSTRRAIAKICADSGPNDALMIHYCGSSFLDERKNLFLPVRDSDMEYPDATAIEPDFILERMRKSACRQLLVVVDGCHAGAFFKGNRGIPDGLWALTACSEEEETIETAEGGLFTRALIAGLLSPTADGDGDGWISVDDLHSHAVDFVATEKCMSIRPQKWMWNVHAKFNVAQRPLRVFLSYCREDVEVAKDMRRILEENELSVWLDLEGIEGGDWRERVTDAITKARALVVVLTRNAFASSAVKNELLFAGMHGVPIVPVVVEPMASKDIPNWFHLDFGAIHRHEMDRGGLHEMATKVVRAIRAAKPAQRDLTTATAGSTSGEE